LQTCGRSHSLEEVYAAIDAVKAVGFPSWSLDLISGLPKLALSVWQHSLDEAVAAGPNHISIYDLQVRHGVMALKEITCTVVSKKCMDHVLVTPGFTGWQVL
jgi:coproporphyrinogen III oxidase-like Fe-S oxidoreductase